MPPGADIHGPTSEASAQAHPVPAAMATRTISGSVSASIRQLPLTGRTGPSPPARAARASRDPDAEQQPDQQHPRSPNTGRDGRRPTA